MRHVPDRPCSCGHRPHWIKQIIRVKVGVKGWRKTACSEQCARAIEDKYRHLKAK